MMLANIVAALALAIWIYLLLGHGGFWRSAERDEGQDAPLVGKDTWPAVTVVIPARDEAECIGETVASLLRQDYPGHSIVLVDDASGDGTAEVAQRAAMSSGMGDRLRVVAGRPLPPQWTGKLWALKQGIETAQSGSPPPDYLLLTDADIVYQPGVLRSLVARALANRLVLTSLMVKLRCESTAERALIPAFVFFFQMLYPFAWVQSGPIGTTAAAAGGCIARCAARSCARPAASTRSATP